jgi:hypothetical protein
VSRARKVAQRRPAAPVVPPTPGPITVEESAGGYVLKSESVGAGYYAGIGGATQRDPHPVDGGGISRETALANATLWGAAPQLLEALKLAEAHLLPARAGSPAGERALVAVRAAIAKATGEGA